MAFSACVPRFVGRADGLPRGSPARQLVARLSGQYTLLDDVGTSRFGDGAGESAFVRMRVAEKLFVGSARSIGSN